ncbi:unnamed protein product [Cylindrotheca closterium]|uniref:Uncharacterized protein n=1 Tax=Cylindrotheca closterium TaxID=2856 RepID=A0AAD2FSL0_9STRA|nr:unnamed protein product [Cylindrotheca closterium]
MAETLLQGDWTAIANLARIDFACVSLINGSDVSPRIPRNQRALQCTRRLADSDKEIPAWSMSGNMETRLVGVYTRPHSSIVSAARACFQSSEERSCYTKGKATVIAAPPKCCRILSNNDSTNTASSSSSIASSTRVAGSDAHSSKFSLTPLAMGADCKVVKDALSVCDAGEAGSTFNSSNLGSSLERDDVLMVVAIAPLTSKWVQASSRQSEEGAEDSEIKDYDDGVAVLANAIGARSAKSASKRMEIKSPCFRAGSMKANTF